MRSFLIIFIISVVNVAFAGGLIESAGPINHNDTMAQVRSVFGKPSGRMKIGKEETWLYEQGKVIFRNGKVYSYSLLTAEQIAEKRETKASRRSVSKKAPVEIIKEVNPDAVAELGGGDLVSKLTKASVIIRTNQGHGTGFFVSSDGYIVTACHVLAGADGVEVMTSDGKKYKVYRVAAHSIKKDLALLKIDGSTFPYLKPKSLKDVKNGDAVCVMGHPYNGRWVLTKGHLASKRKIEDMVHLQFSADISPGNSGGAVTDTNGNFCAVASYMERNMIKWNSGEYTLDPSRVFKFGISSDDVLDFLENKPNANSSFKQITDIYFRLVYINDMTKAYQYLVELLPEYIREGKKGVSSGKVTLRWDYGHKTAQAKSYNLPASSQYDAIFLTPEFEEAILKAGVFDLFMRKRFNLYMEEESNSGLDKSIKPFLSVTGKLASSAKKYRKMSGQYITDSEEVKFEFPEFSACESGIIEGLRQLAYVIHVNRRYLVIDGKDKPTVQEMLDSFRRGLWQESKKDKRMPTFGR